MEAKAAQSEELQSRLDTAEARVVKLETRLGEQPLLEAKATQLVDLQTQFSSAKDIIVDLEAELLIMNTDR